MPPKKAPSWKAPPTKAPPTKAPPPGRAAFRWQEFSGRVFNMRAETIAREARETAVAIRWQTFVRRLPPLPVTAAAA